MSIYNTTSNFKIIDLVYELLLRYNNCKACIYKINTVKSLQTLVSVS